MRFHEAFGFPRRLLAVLALLLAMAHVAMTTLDVDNDVMSDCNSLPLTHVTSLKVGAFNVQVCNPQIVTSHSILILSK